MGTALIGGLVEDGYPADRIGVSDLDTEKLDNLRQQYGINISAKNGDIVARSQTLVLAVKPQIMQQVANEIRSFVLASKPLVISIAAGIRESDLQRWLGGLASIVRSMPNTPALVRTGATALHAGLQVTAEQRDRAESIMRAVGLVVWVKSESDLDAVTALSGSGPAYFFMLMETMEQAALELGLDQQTVRLLVEQTAFGAAKVALEVEESPAELRRRVTSPGGTTERAIEVFEKGGMGLLVANALQAARARSVEMSNELGGK